MVSMESGEDQHLSSVHVDLWRHGFPTVSLRKANRLYLVLSPACSKELLLHVVPRDVLIGISRPTAPSGMQRALQESLWALGTAKSASERVVRYAEGPTWLGLTNFDEGQALVQRLLGPVLDYEEGRQGDLISTLRTYLASQRSWQKTAEVLFAHRQTVTYRIGKISELTGLDMRETSTLAQLWFALQIHDAMDLGSTTNGSPTSQQP